MRHFYIGSMFLFGVYPLLGGGFAHEDVTFTSHGVSLAGSVIIPKTGPIHAAVVFVHGSGKQRRNLHWAERFAADGIAALVYDKRGAGDSGGTYEGNQSVSEKNITLLADDAAAALAVLRKHPQTKDVPLGLTGISQAGWIVPLAAEQVPDLAFLVLWSAPVCKVSEEDIFSKYTADKDQQQIPSYTQALAARKQAYVWPGFLGKDSNPGDNLINLKTPGLWIFGGRDGSIPVDLSISRLNQLTAKGLALEYVLFSHQGHNNMIATFATATDWIRRTVDNQ